MKPTDALDSNFIGITTLHVSGSLSAHHQEFLAVCRHWYILCRFDDRLLPGAGSKRSSNLHKMYQCRRTAKNSWWWAEGLPKTCRVLIPIKLEFNVSVGFIHKEVVELLSCTWKNIIHKIMVLLSQQVCLTFDTTGTCHGKIWPLFNERCLVNCYTVAQHCKYISISVCACCLCIWLVTDDDVLKQWRSPGWWGDDYYFLLILTCLKLIICVILFMLILYIVSHLSLKLESMVLLLCDMLD